MTSLYEILFAIENLPPGWPREAVLAVPAYQQGISVLNNLPYQYYLNLKRVAMHMIADVLSLTQTDLQRIVRSKDILPVQKSLRTYLRENPPPDVFEVVVVANRYSRNLPPDKTQTKQKAFQTVHTSRRKHSNEAAIPPGWPLDVLRRVPAYWLSIDILKLPTHFHRALKRGGIHTIADLLSFTPDELLSRVYQFGEKGLLTVQLRLEPFLSLAPLPQDALVEWHAINDDLQGLSNEQ